MDNAHIIDLLKDTAKLLELHGANPFQVRHYNNAAVGLEKIDQEVAGLSSEALDAVAGLQPNTKKLIQEIF